jgi:hypothetical protein
MGYTTEFRGSFELNKPLDEKTNDFLVKLSKTRRMARNLPKEYGVEGEFYVDGSGEYGQDKEDNIIDYNRPPKTQPSLWCQWVPADDGRVIEWDGNEKFYDYVEWIEYLIAKVLAPKGYILDGDVDWRGEDREDLGTISINNNKVTLMGKSWFDSHVEVVGIGTTLDFADKLKQQLKQKIS